MGRAELPDEVRRLEERFKLAADARKPFDIEWTLDLAFYAGHQYTEWSNARSQFQTIPRDPKRPNSPRPVANKIYHFVMDTYAAAKGHDPGVEVLPTSSDAMEAADTKLAQAWLDYNISPTRANWIARRNAALFWAVLVGEGWLKWTMNAAKGRPDIESCSPLEIYLPPNVASYLDAPWIIHARGMDPDDVYERYGVELPASSVDVQDATKAAVLRELGMSSGTPTVTVKELWELPSRRHPAGRMVAWGAGRILHDEGRFPYEHGQIPFTQIGHSPIPGTAHYSSGTKTMRPLQMELNQYHAQKIGSRKKFTNFKWFIDSSLAESMAGTQPDDSDDQVLIGDSRNGMMKPEILQAQMWPDSQDGEWIDTQMQDAVGLHGASMGQAPGRVDSAQGIEQLQEADKSRLSEIEDTLSVAIARGFGQQIELARQYLDEEQIVPDMSGAAPAVRKFKTSQFPAKPMLRVIKGGPPKNRAALRAEVMALWSAGMLGENPRRALDLLGYASDIDFTGEEKDVLEAEMENMLMLQGIPVAPKPWQNHEVHRRVHNDARKANDFATATNDVRGIFDFHDQDTDAAEIVEMVEEAERQNHIQQAIEAVMPPPVTQDPAAPVAGTPIEGQPTGQGPQTGA